MSNSQINLPKTAFSMKANLPVREPEILEYWKKINLYQELRQSSKGKEKFVLHDGPPYANGNIHMGTALNKILKDIIVKFHQMDGKDSIYVPGWDCHGLPIEWKIEEQYKKNKKNKNEVPVVEFRKECRSFAEKWIEVHKGQFKRLGVIGDWENYYSTMSFDAEAQIVRELGKFLKEGSLYRGFKPVLWSTVEKTALADAEVEYQDHKSDTIYTSFPIKSSNLKELEGSEIIIWTTTPWTIPANKALAYNEALDYLLIQLNDEGDFKNRKIVVAEALLESVIKECLIKDYKEIIKFKGKDLKGTICDHPFFDLGYNLIFQCWRQDL
jgi:isoleucyl-tRNA synthetase